ncbi:hypothetical protein BU23DRAFT_594974 [Bimuria novae-zelandiae CBS 107.79]|uniref:Uncharacterized protein n=1 Tax=Bimuria novae-zelandiae CBS 107.79 TaxID=1447943 RepID=A0A6A5VSD2_9PLEO|nr:hypothetical protein BU23DRAFT_594974 [Bimuria novae-zelandiae CBS 107.79]
MQPCGIERRVHGVVLPDAPDVLLLKPHIRRLDLEHHGPCSQYLMEAATGLEDLTHHGRSGRPQLYQPLPIQAHWHKLRRLYLAYLDNLGAHVLASFLQWHASTLTEVNLMPLLSKLYLGCLISAPPDTSNASLELLLDNCIHSTILAGGFGDDETCGPSSIEFVSKQEIVQGLSALIDSYRLIPFLGADPNDDCDLNMKGAQAAYDGLIVQGEEWKLTSFGLARFLLSFGSGLKHNLDQVKTGKIICGQ